MQGQIEQLTCPVCMSYFKKAITLSCGHSFCYNCLLNAARQHRNCPICRSYFACTPNKIKADIVINRLVDQVKKYGVKQQQPKQQANSMECKEERMLLIDITTDDLLLPFNRISATFQLQSTLLIDRLERFVVRQEIPFNKYGVVSRLVHIQQLRKNLFKGVIEGVAFCKISTENVESQLSIQIDEQQFFYRSCNCKEISQMSDCDPSDFEPFLNAFSRLKVAQVKHQLYQQINHSNLSIKSDPIALFYSILGIINMPNADKYALALSFNQRWRIDQINRFLRQSASRLQKDPNYLLKYSNSSRNDKYIALILLFFILLFWLKQYDAQL